ncbi:50S ribosomal protein L20 [Candidatus Kaiserbacteria bacterium RIFCSPHIGHO2_02_FULL_49_16]|uniref:Large ribosomal subunit protein bL20 n=1 Tax=Candidatus Kaiserbacteria bacterium RIFCSPHIGHO2_02_FULL_49_16 TaxID=1798490 RepID=A0A1F6DCT7_9BACT|nr:MAG: 50S ribosomal protein L20 [Candidatus Kaiserbacteria bacterium RIFCSPHIGHO2_02_FULL_49_16]
MSRVKRGVTKLKRRRNILSQVKGYRFGRSTKERVAKEAIRHAGAYAFRHRRAKKRDFRNLWTLRINAASRTVGFTYSKIIDALKKKKIGLDRKSLSALAKDYPATFERLAEQLKK